MPPGATDGEDGTVDNEGQKTNDRPTTNPIAETANVMISVPDIVRIRLVDASVLQDYEVWSLITSILGSGVVGFGVAGLQETGSMATTLFAFTGLLGLLFVITLVTTLRKRSAITEETRQVQFELGDKIEGDR